MSKFKSKPSAKPASASAPASLRAVPDPRAVEQFAKAAGTRSTDPTPSSPALDPKAKSTNGINLRLNDYELDVLRRLAESQDRSIQKTIKRLLLPAAEAELQGRAGE